MEYDQKLIPEKMDANNMVSFLYADSMLRDVQKNRKGLLGDGHSWYLSEDKKSTDAAFCRSTITVEITGEVDQRGYGSVSGLINRLADWEGLG